jgi:DNA-binding Lrp family transcriptional regulator
MELSTRELTLVAAIQGGLPLVSRPYAAIGAGIGMSESEVIERLSWWLVNGTLKRMGVVVRHRELGYQANAMVVWDVPDAEVCAVGKRMGEQAAVTLCYRRPRRLPDWPYNLFCMIHGRDRDVVRGHIDTLIRQCGLEGISHEVLFSRRRFKQRGACYVDAGSIPPGSVCDEIQSAGGAS